MKINGYEENKMEEKFNQKERKSVIIGFGGSFLSTLVVAGCLSLNSPNIETKLNESNSNKCICPKESTDQERHKFPSYGYGGALPLLFLGLGYSIHHKAEKELDEEYEELERY